MFDSEGAGCYGATHFVFMINLRANVSCYCPLLVGGCKYLLAVKCVALHCTDL